MKELREQLESLKKSSLKKSYDNYLKDVALKNEDMEDSYKFTKEDVFEDPRMSFEFTLEITNRTIDYHEDLEAFDALMDDIYEAGCADTIITTSGGIIRIIFIREEDSLEHAIDSARSDLASVGLESKLVETDDD